MSQQNSFDGYSYASDPDGNEGSPDQNLWIAVLALAIEDATRTLREGFYDEENVDSPSGRQRRRELNIQGRQSIEFFQGTGSDFRTVCICAGIDPDYIRDVVLNGDVRNGRIMQRLLVNNAKNTSTEKEPLDDEKDDELEAL